MTKEPEAPVALNLRLGGELYRALTAAARCAYQEHDCTCVPDISVIGGGDDVVLIDQARVGMKVRRL
jgi:hypothetical protein